MRTVHAITSFVSNYWWLIFIVGPMGGGALQRHHSRRLRILAAKSELAEKRNAAQMAPPEPQPICGCSHHLSFHNPVPAPALRRAAVVSSTSDPSPSGTCSHSL